MFLKIVPFQTLITIRMVCQVSNCELEWHQLTDDSRGRLSG